MSDTLHLDREIWALRSDVDALKQLVESQTESIEQLKRELNTLRARVNYAELVA